MQSVLSLHENSEVDFFFVKNDIFNRVELQIVI